MDLHCLARLQAFHLGLGLQLTDLRLLLLDCLDQDCRQARVVQALGIHTIFFVDNDFGNNSTDFFGNDTDIRLAGFLPMETDSTQSLNLFQGPLKQCRTPKQWSI